MATRITEAELKAIMSTTLTEEELSAFLPMANRMTTNVCGGAGYDSGTLKDIELNLAAHFASSRDPELEDEKIGDARAKYRGKTAMGLEFTRYGQNAMALDYKGKLKQVNAGKRPAEIEHLHNPLP